MTAITGAAIETSKIKGLHVLSGNKKKNQGGAASAAPPWAILLQIG
jgi:hypothetical protein